MPVVVDGLESFAPVGSDVCQYLSTNVRMLGMTVNKSHTKGGQYSCDEQMAQGITGQISSESQTSTIPNPTVLSYIK